MSATETTVTLTLGISELRAMFAAGNHSGTGTASDADPLYLAIDIIDHAAMELYTLYDALVGQEDRVEELAIHVWRLSVQLTSSIALVKALNEATHRNNSQAAE